MKRKKKVFSTINENKKEEKEKKNIKKGLDEYFKQDHKKQLIDFSEFKKLSSYKQIQQELLEKQKEKTEKFIEEKREEWEKRKSLIPEFKSKFSEQALYQSNQILEDKKKEEIKFLERKKKKKNTRKKHLNF